MIERTDKEIADDAIDALQHIIATCRNSRTQTRRIRWIAERAQSGIEGTTAWQKVDFPKKIDSIEQQEKRLARLRSTIESLRVQRDELIGYLDSRGVPGVGISHWKNFLSLNPDFPIPGEQKVYVEDSTNA